MVRLIRRGVRKRSWARSKFHTLLIPLLVAIVMCIGIMAAGLSQDAVNSHSPDPAGVCRLFGGLQDLERALQARGKPSGFSLNIGNWLETRFEKLMPNCVQLLAVNVGDGSPAGNIHDRHEPAGITRLETGHREAMCRRACVAFVDWPAPARCARSLQDRKTRRARNSE